MSNDNLKAYVRIEPLVLSIGGKEIEVRTQLNTFQMIELVGLLTQGVLKSVRYKGAKDGDKFVFETDANGNYIVDPYSTALALFKDNSVELQKAIILIFTKFKVDRNREIIASVDFDGWDDLTPDNMIDIIARIITDNDWAALVKKMTAALPKSGGE